MPGGLARSIRLNVLERSAIALSDAGIPSLHPGLVQMMAPEGMIRLADFIGCDAGDLIRQAGIRHDRSVEFDGLHLPRGDIELERRRVAPTTLGTLPFHRSSWLMRTLPFCPVSLERMVDTCPRCEVALGWSRCWGIETCERCRELVPPSPDAALPADWAEDYRLFAELLSLDHVARNGALEQLPEQLRQIAPGTLIQMVIRLGATCRPEPIKNVRRECVAQLPPQTIAGIIATGMSMLRAWPTSFTDWAGASLAEHIDDLPGYHSIRGDIRRLGNGRFEDAVQAELVRAAMPSEFGSFYRSAPAAEFMTGLELKGIAHLRPAQLKLVRSGIEDRRLPSIDRQRSQYNVKKAREFVARYHDSRKLEHLTFELMLPTYAIEQMICLGMIDEEGDELVRLARGGLCAKSDAVDTLVARLRRKASVAERPGDAVSLAVAARCIGGREKPWAEIFRALLGGRIAFWVSEKAAITTRTIKVQRTSLMRFQRVAFRRTNHPGFPFSPTFAKFEAEDILNIPAKTLKPLIDAGHLEFRRERGRHVADIDVVLDLARDMVAFAELGAHTGWSYWHACDETDRLGIGRFGVGWCRHGLVDHGLIPGPNAQDLAA